LRTAGFRKSARTFRRDLSSRTQVINVQGSQWNSPDDAQVTINLGVYYPEMASLLDWRLLAKAGPLESDCQARQRIGFLLPKAQDHWWQLSVAFDAPRLDFVAAEIRDAVVEQGLPWLDAHIDLAVTRDDFVRMRLPWLAAVASVALGDRERAALQLRLAIDGFPDGAPRMAAWGQAHGIALGAAG
jgi:hypothetical protein